MQTKTQYVKCEVNVNIKAMDETLGDEGDHTITKNRLFRYNHFMLYIHPLYDQFQYYGHREKLRLIGKEDQLETINRKALSIASEVAKATGTLFAGNICNTTIYRRNDPETFKTVRDMFKVRKKRIHYEDYVRQIFKSREKKLYQQENYLNQDVRSFLVIEH